MKILIFETDSDYREQNLLVDATIPLKPNLHPAPPRSVGNLGVTPASTRDDVHIVILVSPSNKSWEIKIFLAGFNKDENKNLMQLLSSTIFIPAAMVALSVASNAASIV